MPQSATAFSLSNSSHPATCRACRDGFLRMWDLVKGRCTYTVRLEAEAEAVHFCQEDGGARYALLCGTLLTLHSVGEAGTLRTLAHPRRALCMAWVPGGRIVSGSEDGSLRLWDTQVWCVWLALVAADVGRWAEGWLLLCSRIERLLLFPGMLFPGMLSTGMLLHPCCLSAARLCTPASHYPPAWPQ